VGPDDAGEVAVGAEVGLELGLELGLAGVPDPPTHLFSTHMVPDPAVIAHQKVQMKWKDGRTATCITAMCFARRASHPARSVR
jgi:hypothetical protein